MPLSAGTRLGPYEILDFVGAGGMGEVYRARDPRLGRDVAVKVLPDDIAGDPDRLRRFEREARAVAALSHPNVVVVHDVGTDAGRPYVVTELLEGETLGERLRKGALSLREAVETAVHVAHGLAAAHAKTIAHRDLKPANVFLTTDGRVKILDFGLARWEGLNPEETTASAVTGQGTCLGTVGYMSPEQVRGGRGDHRSDIFSFGVLLYEMVSGRHPFRRKTGVETQTAILREEPLALNGLGLPEALEQVVLRCLEKRPEDRFHSAHDLALALQSIAGAPLTPLPRPGVPEPGPYPGLRPFTEEQKESFFGREAEAAALWEKLNRRKLLSLIGPSGVGKTSFVRAGLVPARPSGWRCVTATPGRRPFAALARALVPELASDTEALQELVGFDDPDVAVGLVGRWRRRHAGALVVVDQLEELFTLNPPDVQAAFAQLLRRLCDEADVHVLLSLRDDFFFSCHAHPALAEVFTEVTPLGPLAGDALRRALVEPAERRGFRFEDEALVDEMCGAVEGERGALPLLAFCAAELWERRDREGKLLTRDACEEIGGVAGALAQHAEATLEGIGTERQGIVREIFRNLVTAQGTRAACEREELLSVFPDRKAEEEVLSALVDARLLTSYEDEGTAEGSNHHRIEIVHESLLKAWPRLVRWLAQDEEGALLRDQLKQAAHLWDERSRPADLLWGGTSFREYELWRERYSGKLTALEEQFAKAMTDQARRMRRLRQAAVAAVVVVLSAVAIVVSVLWHQAVLQAEHAAQQARLAQASKLVALGRNQIDVYPTAALAYARKSLEVADTAEARRLALEALWRGPTVRILPMAVEAQHWVPEFSPDGEWLATAGVDETISLFRADGTLARTIRGLEVTAEPRWLKIDARSRRLATGTGSGPDRLFSLSDGRELPSIGMGPRTDVSYFGETLIALTVSDPPRELAWREWPLDGGSPRTLARMATAGVCQAEIDPAGRRIVYGRGQSVFLRELVGGPDRLIGTHDHPLDENSLRCLALTPSGDRVASIDTSREVRIWSLRPGEGGPPRVLKGMGNPEEQSPALFDPSGSRLGWGSSDDRAVYLWDVGAPRDAQPVLLRRSDASRLLFSAFTPDGEWLAVMDGASAMFWSVGARHPYVLRGHARGPVWQLAFTADSQWLASGAFDGARLWPMTSRGASGYPDDRVQEGWIYALTTAPSGATVLVSGAAGDVNLVPIGDGPVRNLLVNTWDSHRSVTGAVAFDLTGQRVAWASGYAPDPADKVLRAWDLGSGKEWVWPLCGDCDKSKPFDRGIHVLRFAPDGSLLAGGLGGVRRWNVETGESHLVLEAPFAGLDASRDGHLLLVWAGEVVTTEFFRLRQVRAQLMDLRNGTSRPITGRGDFVDATLDASGRVLVTAHADGSVRVGPVAGGEPHLLLGHGGPVAAVAVSPDGRWIASSSGTEIRLWPMPDVSQPPFHTLPYAALMAKLGSLTNLRVVEDTASPTGYRLDIGPFPGWKDVPTW